MPWIAVPLKFLLVNNLELYLSARQLISLPALHMTSKNLNQGLTASLLTLDVKGAFDAGLPGRLVRRLREQG